MRRKLLGIPIPAWILVIALAVLGVGTSAAGARPSLEPTTTGGLPGVRVQITEAQILPSLQPQVTVRLTDGTGQPLTMSDIDAGSLRFTVDHIQPDPETGRTQYLNYIVNNVQGRPFTVEGQSRQPALSSATQAGLDTGGTFEERGGGVFVYTFRTALPADFDPTHTHTIGTQVTRSARRFASNDVFHFVPAGGPVQVMREIVKIESCNRCHDPLAFHGGGRVDTRLCVLCHTPQTTDPESGNTVDFKVMVHRIHRSENLPSVQAGQPYVIVGFGQNAIDLSEILFPQDVRNCTTCHTGPQGENWKTAPSAAACGSCHDSVNFQTGANHPGGPQPDTACKGCHVPDGPEFGLSIAGAHTIPTESQQMRGVTFEIVSVSNTGPGQSPTVVFNIKDRNGEVIAPSAMSRIALTLAGPTTDYMQAITEVASGATDAGDGNFSYTFSAKVPNAAGSVAVGIEGYIDTQLKDPRGNTETTARDVGFNKVAYSGVTDPVAMARKAIVVTENCNACHEKLALHGGIRQNVEYCVLCHNPRGTDEAKRQTAGGPLPPESIHFKRLIHKIHTGEELNQKPYIIYGGSPANPGPIDLSVVRFPGDRRNCEKCHIAGSQLLPFLHEGAVATTPVFRGQVLSSIPPISSACTSCHDSISAQAHAETNTADDGDEACLVCHNEGRDFAVSRVHAR